MSALREKYARVVALPKYEELLANTRTALSHIDDDIAKLLRQYQREKRDVERIERDGLSAFLLRLVGRYEDKLEKEQQQEIDAKLAYDKAKIHRQHLIEEELTLHQKVVQLKDEEKALSSEFDARRKKLAGRATEHCDIINKMTDIEEAQRTIKQIGVTVEDVIGSLNSAKGWATFDMFTRGGILTHISKYSHLDEAEAVFYTLSSQMKRLTAQLKGMHYVSMPEFNGISKTERAIDFWFDNIFTNISVREQIVDNLTAVRGLANNLHQVNIVLGQKFAQLEKQEEELLLSMDCL
ncbi:MAG: MICOS complex subunit MIC60 [Defluviitaleaceae bacterium]|nr:MICOS complex subunit MIC60 [Defluviitaleaceae bacterium]